MSDPFARAVDVAFKRLGVDGVLDPDGQARAVKLIPVGDGESISDYGSVRLVDATGNFDIRAGEFSGFSDRVAVQIGAVRRRIQSHRVIDARGLRIRLDTVAI